MKYIKIAFLLSIFYILFSTVHAATGTVSYTPTKVNMQKVRTARLSRHNTERKLVWLTAYTGSAKLDATAQKRAEYLAKINTATHKRLQSGNGKPTDIYYNYKSIKARFTGQNINFPPEKSGVPNFTENLAYQYYKCTKDDCTADMITAIKIWFAFFMSEKILKGPHYKAIIGKQFKIVGMWIGVVRTRYYIVTHYATEIVK